MVSSKEAIVEIWRWWRILSCWELISWALEMTFIISTYMQKSRKNDTGINTLISTVSNYSTVSPISSSSTKVRYYAPKFAT